CFHWLFAGEIVALPEGPEERVVFGCILWRGLEGDPGFCQLGALAVGQDVTAGFGELDQHGLGNLDRHPVVYRVDAAMDSGRKVRGFVAIAADRARSTAMLRRRFD